MVLVRILLNYASALFWQHKEPQHIQNTQVIFLWYMLIGVSFKINSKCVDNRAGSVFG